MPPLGVVEGYIIQYSEIDQKLINGEIDSQLINIDTSSHILEGLTQGMIYQFSVFAYIDLPSSESDEVTLLLDGM